MARRPGPAQGPRVVPIPGTKTPGYLADNAGAANVQLSPDDLADLADLDAIPGPRRRPVLTVPPRRR
ncbi:hypothetical protein ACWEWI_13440 [Streptomyces sp. NPDC003753]